MHPKPRHQVELNLPQMLGVMAKQKRRHFEWGRGTGKSTVLAYMMMQMAITMPRGKFALAGTSFRSMLGETLPSTIEGLEMFGIFQGIHFYVGQRAPLKLGWGVPFQPPNDWTNCIHFFTGAAFFLVSQDKSSLERRGHNFDAVIGDEAAQLDEKRLYNEVLAGNRTHRAAFLEAPLYQAEIFTSTTPMTRAGLWFIKNEENARAEPEKFFHLRASSRHNAHNLAPDWLDRMKKQAPSELHYRAEILNIRPRLTVNAFYPALKEKHYYSALDGDHFLNAFANRQQLEATSLADRDCDPDRPLRLVIDPGADINAACVKQKSGRTVRTLKSMTARSPNLIWHLIENQFVPYYRHHRAKVVDLWYDRTANNRQPDNNRTLAERIRDMLMQHGWKVNLKMVGAAVIHQDEKHKLIAMAMEEDDLRMPIFRINKDNCRDLIISLENAEAKEDSRGRIKKNKASERQMGSIPREHATDLSDAWDLDAYYDIKAALKGEEQGAGGMVLLG